MNSGIKTTSSLGDTLAARHLQAEDIVGNNLNVKQVSKVKYPKGTSEDIKKLVKFYKFEKTRHVTSAGLKYIKAAFDLYTRYSDRSTPKWIVEALLLGGATYKDTARMCGLPEKVVSYYCKFYFDIKMPGNIALIDAATTNMAGTYTKQDRGPWGYKMEVLANGLDWFIRVRIEKKLSKEDKRTLDDYVRHRIGQAHSSMSIMIENEDNYTNNPGFKDMVDAVGSFYSRMQKDVELAAKPQLGNSQSDTADVMVKKTYNAFYLTGKDPRDTKVSAFDENIAKEETLPI